MTANQITKQDVFNLISEAGNAKNARAFSSTRVFREFCEAFEIEPTKRQASKFSRKTGVLFAKLGGVA